jgi:hypothetical protein
MTIKQRLFSILVAGFTIITIQAIDFDNFSQTPCNTCDQVKLNDFWTKAKNGEFDKEEIKKHLDSEILNNKNKSYEDYSNILQQAVCSGKIDPSYQPHLLYSKEYNSNDKDDIVGIAIQKEDLNLLDICLEQEYSPNDPITINKEKISILRALKSTPFSGKKPHLLHLQIWSRLKKYNANFNMPIDDRKRTLLHDLIHDSDVPEQVSLIQWLLKETNIDINKPDVDGNTAGHIIAHYHGINPYSKSKNHEAAFDIFKNNSFNPLQRNNYGQTAKDMIRTHSEKNQKIISLWEQYETEYKLNNPDYATNQKCYNQQNTINLNPIVTSQKAQKAYNFFPRDSKIGNFCKNNPLNLDCLRLAELFTAANKAYHAIVDENNISNSCSNYSKEEKILREKIYFKKDNILEKMRNKTFTNEELNLLDPETQKQLDNVKELGFPEKDVLIEKIINVIGNIPFLKNELAIVEQQHQNASKEFTKAIIKEQECCKKIEGNYQPLYFDKCQDSWYHQSVKKLLKKVITNPFYTKQLHQGKEIDVLTPEVEEECLLIGKALYNARYNQKQS